MRNLKTNKIKYLARISMAFLMFFVFSFIDPIQASQPIYIAGNPDLDPIEYYDEEKEVYLGILPEIYQQISENTGIIFEYIHPGSENHQQRLVKNKQVEIVSAHIQGSIEAIEASYPIFTYEKEGKEIVVCIGFTEIISQELMETIMNQIQFISDEQLLDLALTWTTDEKEAPIPMVMWMGYLFLLIVVAILIFYILSGQKKLKLQKINQFIDPLTGIGNEEYYAYSYKQMISESERNLYYMAYIAADIQHIESLFGIMKADEMQKYAADIISKACRETDFAARINDGIFAYVFQSPNQKIAFTKIEKIVDECNQSTKKLSDEYSIQFHAGVYPLTAFKLTAHNALQNAKQGYTYAVQRKQHICFCDEKILDHEQFKQRLQRKILHAINDHEFTIYLQFIVDINLNKICGAEALSRWQSPQEGILTPMHYIDFMTTAGIIDQLDFVTLDMTCELLEKWSQTDKQDLWISCNFTRLTVSQEDFLSRFFEIIQKYQFNHKNLVIELTEDTLTDDKTMAYQNVVACKKAGFTIALDDMGSGYSSLRDLSDYPIDIIKIDKDLTTKAVTERGKKLLRGIANLAHDLNIQVLCEGVEGEEEREVVLEAKCDYIQGFYYSRVLPVDFAEEHYSVLKSRDMFH